MKLFVVLCLVGAAVAYPQILLGAGPTIVRPLQQWGYNSVAHTVLAAPQPAVAPAIAAPAPAPAAVVAAPAPVAIIPSSQHHAQNELGGYNYGYVSADGQAKQEVRNLDGSVVGSYSYLDPSGRPIQVNYISDALGFRTLSNNIPTGPALPEANVRAAAEHARLFAEAAARAAAAPDDPPAGAEAGEGKEKAA